VIPICIPVHRHPPGLHEALAERIYKIAVILGLRQGACILLLPEGTVLIFIGAFHKVARLIVKE